MQKVDYELDKRHLVAFKSALKVQGLEYMEREKDVNTLCFTVFYNTENELLSLGISFGMKLK